jgi:AcrR family transcriptional regulator
VAAALAVADSVGLEGLTIRAVARFANVPTMSLYTHFTSKEELLDLMYSEIILRLYADAEYPTWQAGLLALCDGVRTTLVAHPHWVPLLSRSAMPLAIPLRERLLSLMASDGMTPAAAFSALSTAVLAAVGLVLVELELTRNDGPSSIAQRFARLRDWAHGPACIGHPTTRQALSVVEEFDLNRNFAMAMETFVKGLELTRTSRG